MIAPKASPQESPGYGLPSRHVAVCSRCGQAAEKLYPFPLAVSVRHPILCSQCQDAWDEFLLEAVRRWHEGLRSCFLCKQALGERLFQANSPLGPCCVKCSLGLAASDPRAS